MSREFPDWIDPWKAAEGKRVFSGTIRLASLKRLVPLLAGTGGEARFTASFELDSQKRAMLDIEVAAELPLICQASLDLYRHPIARRSRLAVLATESEQDQLPEDYEATCAHDGRLSFAEVVEDELLLAVPQVPRKPGLRDTEFSADPTSGKPPEGRETYRPFAGLAELMQRRRTEQESDKD